MKKILCPTDFSSVSDVALSYATHIAQQAQAHLLLLHVLHLPIVDTSETALVASELLGEQTRQVSEKLKAQCMHLERTLGANRDQHLTCSYLVKEALLVDMAKLLTKQEGYDLVVMGTTGCGNTMEELLIGSSTEAVIEEVKCPVLSIPATAPKPTFQRIVYASDYHEEDFVALKEVVALGSLFGSAIHVVHVVKASTEESRAQSEQFWGRLRAAFPGVPLVFQEVISKHRQEGLKQYYNEVGGSVLAVLRREKGFFKELFSQSLAERLTYKADVPLLVLHA